MGCYSARRRLCANAQDVYSINRLQQTIFEPQEVRG
jgi:hypothetical protein